MASCGSCGAGGRTYDCEHTNFEGWCKECYMELHHRLTE
ncbi:conserved hypothetical protein [Nitrosopumilaceae archaeon]|nr:conserved hypothetical protein [Nitrosopumilaceae archaeon]